MTICWECGEGIVCTCPPAWEEPVTKIKDPDACEYCGDTDGCVPHCACPDCAVTDPLSVYKDDGCDPSDGQDHTFDQFCQCRCTCDSCLFELAAGVPLEDDEERFDEEAPEYRYIGPTFQSAFKEIFDEAFVLLVDRQRKYGPDNIYSLGLFGVFDRLASDKVERVRRSFNGVIQHGRVILDPEILYEDETLEDALLDIANYALIMLALKRGVWGYPLAPETEEGSK